MKKGNLLIVASTFPRWANDSVPPFVYLFAKNLKNDFKRITVVAPHYKGAKTTEIMSGVSVRRFKYFWPASQQNIVYGGSGANKVSKSPWYLLKLACFLVEEFISVVRVVRKEKIDIINAHWIVPQGFMCTLVGKLLSKPVFITIHGSDIFTLNGSVMRFIKRYALKNATGVVVNSRATQKACRDIYAEREYPIIPMGVDVTKFKKSQKETDKDTFVVTSTGRLSPEKGMYELVKSLRDLLKKLPEIKLQIIGEGPERSRIEQYISEQKLEQSVILLGWKSHAEIADVYANSDLFIGLSQSEKNHKEGFGLVFAEAAAAGLPVIATKQGGINDVVKDGETGYLIAEKNSKLLREKVIRLCKDRKLAEKMGRRGQKLIQENYSWPHVTKQYKMIFQEEL